MGPNHTINPLPHSHTFNIYTTISSITTPHANNVHTLNRTSSTTWILNSADEHWKHNKTRRFYGYSHTTPTTNPHHSLVQQLGLGITKAFSQHLLRSIKLATTNTNNPMQEDSNDLSILSTSQM